MGVSEMRSQLARDGALTSRCGPVDRDCECHWPGAFYLFVLPWVEHGGARLKPGSAQKFTASQPRLAGRNDLRCGYLSQEKPQERLHCIASGMGSNCAHGKLACAMNDAN
jgi:hypothetical protein